VPLIPFAEKPNLIGTFGALPGRVFVITTNFVTVSKEISSGSAELAGTFREEVK
jgi:hypothetical protein